MLHSKLHLLFLNRLQGVFEQNKDIREVTEIQKNLFLLHKNLNTTT